MATPEKDLVFEGFLRKRKDTMIFTWSKYWFRLRNTTLSFFTTKEADESCLRGKYYIYLVQSVREIGTTESNYTFEIVMKNGKRKLLSADTAELRAVWIEYLWKAMQLPAPGRKNSSCTWHDIPTLEQRAQAAVMKIPDSKIELGDSPREQNQHVPKSHHEENENYSEDEADSSNYELPNFKSGEEGIKTEDDEENESHSDEEASNIYDVPRLKSETEDKETCIEKEHDSEPEDYDIYDFPTLIKTVSPQCLDDGEQDFPALLMKDFDKIATSIFQGEAIDDTDEKATDPESISLDENSGVTLV